MSLEPIEPETAYELYLADREHELAEASLQGHRYRLKHFVRWSREKGITNLNTLNGRLLHEYRMWRREDGDLNKVSEKTQMDTLRVFVRWLESIDAVEQDLGEKVLSPAITADENSRDVMLEADRADAVLAYLGKYKYASVQHVALSLMWHTMMRVGGVHALDVDDYNSQEQYLEVRHRPDTDTPIKNKGDGERLIAVSDRISDLLDDWLASKWPNVTDDHGREPLLASAQGRTQKTTLQSYIYQWTRPCEYGKECPHDRDPATCEGAQPESPSKCPSSVSPHAIRRGGITKRLNEDIPEKVISDRANVSPEVIDQHYDRRTQREKMEQRREFLGDR
ncbi:tyrosine-type recombinase/integrase [Halorientalis regularis]|uniref:Phage integrase, N-terminal SAM-like domain n=1 Tax=Halorientalis regularis TaxID=660518 RepID=A0A1G7TYL8_9EURY|nr:site-specific integrase [Halorientalis regularis]SDG40383.1 Phage integrase, N-terminal SAM-like domain [Halorientalis regularis]